MAMKSIVVIIDSPLPKWERAFAFFSEAQAEAMARWLKNNGVAATTIPIEEFHKVEHKESLNE